MSAEPWQRFEAWYAEAGRHPEISDASAMALATADGGARPSVRMVLLKQHDARGLVFFTNLQSPKARDLADNARAALCFYWAPLERQVRVEGAVQPVSDAEADAYFATRPRLSQLGAWASRQSEPMAHRFGLPPAVALAAARFGMGKVPRPPHWSGCRVVPDSWEFWEAGENRLHRRMLWRKTESGWEIAHLFP